MNRVSGDDDSSSAPRRDSKEGSRGRNDEAIDREVREQIKSGHSSYSMADIARLRERYKDAKLVDTIVDAYADKMDEIREHAKHLADKIVAKYGAGNTPLHRIMEYIASYRTKSKMDDATFQEVRRLVQLRLAGINTDITQMRTNIGKALGYAPSDASDGLNIEDKDNKHLEDILKRYEETKVLYYSIMNQALTYRDCAPEAITGTYDREKHATAQHIHPIFAALYLPKIDLIENQTLKSNIGEIVKFRKERKMPRSLPNYSLLHNLVNDPTDMACSDESPMADLRKRFEVQTKIWNVVLALRNGLYYTPHAGEAIRALESCQIPGMDLPDLGFIQDEGTLMRRLLNVFSMRPTMVNVATPLSTLASSPYDRLVPSVKSSQVPMLMLRLSQYMLPGATIDVSQALSSSTLIHDGNVLTTRTQQVVSSYEFLCIYVTRRFQNTITSQYSQAFQFTSLPISTTGQETLNDREIDVNQVLVLPDGMTYKLRSAVAVERALLPNGQSMICGTSAVINMQANAATGNTSDTYLYYSPGASRFRTNVNGAYVNAAPITVLPYQLPLNPTVDDESYYNIVSRRATLLIYVRQ
jgi:hypothetical protein